MLASYLFGAVYKSLRSDACFFNWLMNIKEKLNNINEWSTVTNNDILDKCMFFLTNDISVVGDIQEDWYTLKIKENGSVQGGGFCPFCLFLCFQYPLS